MSSEPREVPEQASGSASRAEKRGADALATDCSVQQNWAWNIRMGADNVAANARQVMESKGVVIQSSSGGFMWGEGPSRQTVTFVTQLTGAGPLSFCVLTVADTNDAQAVTLRDQIWADLKPRIGVP
jgi:hypothetical protein